MNHSECDGGSALKTATIYTNIRLDDDLAAIVTLAHQVTAKRIDHPDAREHLSNRFGDAGLIELAYALNGAAILPGIKRTLGYATTCDIELMRKVSGH